MDQWKGVRDDVIVGPPDLLLEREEIWEGAPWIVDLLTPHVEENAFRNPQKGVEQAWRTLEDAAFALAGGFVVGWKGQEEVRLQRNPQHRERFHSSPCWLIPPLPAPVQPSPLGSLILWGGGAWDWLDVRTFSQALKLHQWAGGRWRGVVLADRYPGAWRRTPSSVCSHQGLEVRANTSHKEFLKDAREAGAWISLHPEGSAEASVAFRTRLLDAGEAGKPVIVTPGEWLGDFIVEKGGGWHTPCGDSQGLGRLLGGLDKEEMVRRGKRAKEAVRGLQREEISFSQPLTPPPPREERMVIKENLDKAFRGISGWWQRGKEKWVGRR